MTNVYLFVMASGQVSQSAPIFKVTVGDSGKELKAWKSLCKTANKKGWFLKPWNDKSEYTCKDLLMPRSVYSNYPCPAFQVRECTALALWYAIANDCIRSIRRGDVQEHLLAALRIGSNPFSFVRERSDRNNRLLLTYSRKNLSQQSGTPLCDVCCPFATRCPDYHVARLCQCYDADDRKGLQAAMNKLLLEPACDHDVEPVK